MKKAPDAFASGALSKLWLPEQEARIVSKLLKSLMFKF